MRKLRELLFLVGVACLVPMACGDESQPDSDNCEEGAEGCPCYGNETCNAGLECRSHLCVEPGSGTGGSGGQTGNDCPTGTEECLGSCVDTQSDEANCGSCGNTCGTGEECATGTCGCLTGRAACGSECVDTSSDPDNCGGCETVCTADQVCSEGACSDDCATTLTPCGRSCVDTNTSTDHCGACDVACDAGRTCAGGECVCPDGLTACGESCADLDEDSTHCGECGHACGAREGCVAGMCECAAGSVRCGSDCVAGTSCGTGGSGTGGSAGMGGSAGSGGSSGRAGAESGGGGGTGGTGPSGPPIVELLVDNSSSMYEPRAELWDALYSALMDEADGAVGIYEDRVRIGFSSFRGPTGVSGMYQESDPACAQIETVGSVSPATVAPAFDNRTAIDTVYRAIGIQGRNAMADVDGGLLAWQTPTGHALKRVVTTLNAFNANPAGRKYVFLLTDGEPNTCPVQDPQCGQDQSVKAAQDARVLGITTLILGFGDVIRPNSGCTPSIMPCGERHLQDMANAGTARPVETPQPDYFFLPCASVQSGMQPGLPVATYVPAGMGGNAVYYNGTGRAALRTELIEMFDAVLAGTVP